MSGQIPLRTTSLRRRVTVSVILVLAVVLFTVLLVVNALFAVLSNRNLTAVLTDHAQTAQQLAARNTAPQQLLRRVDTGGVRALLVLADGQVFGGVPDGATGNPPPRSRTVVLRGVGRLNGARLTLSVETTVIATAQTQLRRLLLLTGLIALAVTAVLLVLVIRFALAPLDAMTGLARSIARGGRGKRLWPTRTNTELGRTAAAFDDMLDALEGAEHQARLAEGAARASAERTKRFVADAAHELRTPIAGVQAAAEAVLQQPADAAAADRERLQLLLIRESRRAGQLVNDLLDLARIDAGVELTRVPTDLRALAESEAERTRLLAPDMPVEVDGPALVVPADQARITQILANLLDNARQANPPDGRIDIRLAQLGPFAEVLVLDTGPGVPEPDRERIFDRLVRLDQARDRRSGGSGLGLAIARGFARAHGGELSCEAPPPGRGGAVFRLVLPIGGGPVAASDAPTEQFTVVLPG